ncbi:MAG: hypothetical protein IJZ35_00260 [Clostridia bacterium]|nr:hypothetical protein [Clostridia bacterium]
MANDKYTLFREKYPVFRYKSYSLTSDNDNIYISYDFEIEGLTSFKPEIRIDKRNLQLVNSFDSAVGRKMVFSLGMVEAVSYLKSACCPKMIVECGNLDKDDRNWWKKLYFGGLGEFFYRNGVDACFDDFLTIECTGQDIDTSGEKMNLSGFSVVPVGGGKDSAVSAELVKKVSNKILFFTVNSQQARTDTVTAAGYGENDIIKTYRKISPELLELNKQGFLNGHTPFSAIVAFLSLYCAYLTGSKNIVLSNEASANESNIQGSNINHQYSKSYEFEKDFSEYISKNIISDIRYFSLLRPFNELQIAAEFCRHESYLHSFRSCNAGSKNNIWCCNCPKCLFVYGILSAFLPQEKLESIFGENMLDKKELESDFDGLVGLSAVKPFECVGTVSEIKYAVAVCVKNLLDEDKKLPYLAEKFNNSFDINEILKQPLMKEFNEINNIPQEFTSAVKEMYLYVSTKFN